MSGLSDEQRAALEITGDGLVRAGAGAGKTRTLVALCTRDLLEDGVAPERLLVCTFTRAAAGEIRARLARELAGEERARGIDQRAVRAGTIDAICADLVRERALELGLPPSFGLAAAHQTTQIRREAYDYARTQLGGRLMDLSPLIDPSDDDRLRRTLERLFERSAARGVDPAALVEGPFALAPEGTERLAADLDALALEGGGAATLIRADTALLRTGQVERISPLFWRGLPWPLRPRADELRARLEAALPGVAHARAAPARAVLAEMCRLYATWRQARSIEEGLLGYADIALLCREGILAGAITRRFRHVYLDEAQDANPLQLDILRRLRSDDGRMLAIGDLNQSIYAWRLADPDAFVALGREWSDHAPLSANHRTSPHLLRAISAVAGGLPELSPEASGMSAALPERPADPPFTCLFLVEPGPRPPSARAEAAASIDAIEDRRRALGLGHGDVAVLCRSTAAAGDWAEALRARGIPALVLRRGGVIGARESTLALDYLRLVADPSDEEALLSVLSGPLAYTDARERARVFAMDPGTRWTAIREQRPGLALALRRHISLRGVLGVEELCRRALEETGYLDSWAEADPSGTAARNLSGLIARIGAVAADGADLATTLRIIAELEDEEGEDQPEPAPPAPDLAAVRVMTIHGAKGEEFGMVVLAGISQRPGIFRQAAEVDREGQVGVCVHGPARLGLIGDNVARAVDQEDRTTAAAEERRLAYVGMTRARRGLVVVLSGRFDGNGEAQFERIAAFLAPVLLPRGDLPLPGEVRRDQLTAEATLEIERLSVLPPAQASMIEPEPAPEAEGRPLAACLPLSAAPLSYTALADWSRCGLRRHLEADLGLGDPGRPLSAPGGATRLGRRLHRALAAIDWSRPLDQQLAQAAERLRTLSDGDRAHAERVLAGLSALPDLTDRLASASTRAEVRFRLAAPVRLVGRIDLVAEEGDRLLLVDWKTGADAEEQYTDDHALQQDLYALAAQALRPARTRVDLAWVYLAEAERRVEWQTVRAEDGPDVLRAVLEARESVLTKPALPAAETEQPFCAGCPGLIRLCPVASAGS